jgi:putative inorganic carbon (HCO3(-)) transporter
LRRPTAVDLLVIGFVLSAVLSTAFSSFEKTSVVGLAKMMTFFAGYCVFRFLCEPGKRTGRGMTYVLLGGLVLLAVGETLVGLHQYVNHIQPLATWQDPTVNPELKMNRIFGTLKPYNPNLLAGFLIPCLAAAFGLTGVLLSKRRIRLSLLFLLAAGGITVALVLTGSRGGYLSLGGMLLCMFAVVGHFLWHDKVLKSIPRLKALWLLVLFGSVVLGGLVFSVSPALQHRVGSIFAMREDSSNSYRLNVYNSAMQMAKDNPVVGIGPGNGTFKLVYGLYMVPGYNALGAYSVPLEIAVEQGLVGLTVFLLLIITMFLRAAVFLDSDRPLSDKLLVGLLFTGLVGSLIYGLFDTIWYRPSVNLLFWFFVAALAVETEALVEEKPLLLSPGTSQEVR